MSRSLSQSSSADIKPRRIFRAAFQIELKVATFLLFFLSLLSSSLKWYVFNDIVSVCKVPSFHETLFEYSGEILATYSVTAARASFRLSIDPTPIDPGLVCSSRFRLRATPLPIYRFPGIPWDLSPRGQGYPLNRLPLKPVDTSLRSC